MQHIVSNEKLRIRSELIYKCMYKNPRPDAEADTMVITSLQ